MALPPVAPPLRISPPTTPTGGTMPRSSSLTALRPLGSAPHELPPEHPPPSSRRRKPSKNNSAPEVPPTPPPIRSPAHAPPLWSTPTPLPSDFMAASRLMMGPPARALMRSNSTGSIGHGPLNPGSSEPLGEPWRSPGGASVGRLSRWGQPERDPFSEVFGAYCGADQDLDIRGFQRLCKESLLTCETLTASDVNAVFLQLVSQEPGRMTRQQCEAAMQLIAQKKGVEEATVRRAVVVALGPTVRFARHGVPSADDTRTARIDDDAARDRIEQATARAQNALDAALQAGLDTEVDSLKAKAKQALHVALLGGGGGDASEGVQDPLSAEQLEDVKLRARQNLHAAILGPAAEGDVPAELGDQELEEAKANARAALNAVLLENGAEGPGEFTPEELQRAKEGARAALDAVLLLESKELSDGLLKGTEP